MGELNNIAVSLENITDFEFVDVQLIIANMELKLSNIATETQTLSQSCGCIKRITYEPKCYKIPKLPTPNGEILFGNPNIGYTAIVQPFTYTQQDAIGFTGKLNGVNIGNVTNPIPLSNLIPNTQYVLEVTPLNIHGEGNIGSTTLTTLTLGDTVTNGVGDVAGSVGGDIDYYEIIFGNSSVTTTTLYQQFAYTGNDAIGFLLKVNNGQQSLITNPISLSGLMVETLYALSVAPFNNGGTGVWKTVNLTTLGLAPEGVLTIGTVVVGHTHMTVPFMYSLNDVTSFKYSINGGTEIDCVSPIELSELSENTQYVITVRPYKNNLAGNSDSTTQTTLAPLVNGSVTVPHNYDSNMGTYSFSFNYTGNDIAIYKIWLIYNLWSDYGLSYTEAGDLAAILALRDAGGPSVLYIGEVEPNQPYTFTGLPNNLLEVTWIMNLTPYGSSLQYPYPW